MTLTCGRCGQDGQAQMNPRYGKHVSSVFLPPKGWFQFEHGWRCGCILKVKPDCDAEPQA